MYFQNINKQKEIKATTILISLNLVFFCFTLGGHAMGETFGNNFSLTFGQHQYYRLLASLFYHFGILHIICNMLSLYSIGSMVEEQYGKKTFLMIYFLTGILGGGISACIHHMLHQNALSVGASGAICGLLGYYVGKTKKNFSESIKEILISLFPMLIIGLGGGIDNTAHFVCAFLGICFSFLF